jgi:hypothetical protein
MPIVGIDVSFAQAGFNWSRAAQRGLQFGLCKANRGDWLQRPHLGLPLERYEGSWPGPWPLWIQPVAAVSGGREGGSGSAECATRPAAYQPPLMGLMGL